METVYVEILGERKAIRVNVRRKLARPFAQWLGISWIPAQFVDNHCVRLVRRRDGRLFFVRVETADLVAVDDVVDRWKNTYR